MSNRQGIIFELSEDTRITIFIEQDIEHDDLVEANEEYSFFFNSENDLNVTILMWQLDDPVEISRYVTDEIHHRVIL